MSLIIKIGAGTIFHAISDVEIYLPAGSEIEMTKGTLVKDEGGKLEFLSLWQDGRIERMLPENDPAKKWTFSAGDPDSDARIGEDVKGGKGGSIRFHGGDVIKKDETERGKDK